MAIEKVREYLKAWSLADKILEFPVSSATVALAAEALGCEECRIAKTMSFQLADHPIVIVTAGDVKIDNAKFKALFHTKAKMLPHDEVEEKIGHDVGGVCPFAVNEGVEIYLDTSLRKFSTVFPACGSANSAIELTCEELEQYTCNPQWIDVCKAKEG